MKPEACMEHGTTSNVPGTSISRFQEQGYLSCKLQLVGLATKVAIIDQSRTHL